jgi:hypothetical protein
MKKTETRIHVESQIGMEMRMPKRVFWIDDILTDPVSKKVYNKTWWHFYPLLLLCIIAYPIAQAIWLAGLFYIVGLLESIGGVMNPLLAMGFGVIGGMGCIIVHTLTVALTLYKLPSPSRYTYDYSYKLN